MSTFEGLNKCEGIGMREMRGASAPTRGERGALRHQQWQWRRRSGDSHCSGFWSGKLVVALFCSQKKKPTVELEKLCWQTSWDKVWWETKRPLSKSDDWPADPRLWRWPYLWSVTPILLFKKLDLIYVRVKKVWINHDNMISQVQCTLYIFHCRQIKAI